MAWVDELGVEGKSRDASNNSGKNNVRDGEKDNKWLVHGLPPLGDT